MDEEKNLLNIVHQLQEATDLLVQIGAFRLLRHCYGTWWKDLGGE
jgi:hypothetical protein